jgi:membrane protease YdiL (CAAX protease family)
MQEQVTTLHSLVMLLMLALGVVGLLRERQRGGPSRVNRMPPWNISLVEFAFLVCFALLMGFACQIVAAVFLKIFIPEADLRQQWLLPIAGGALQLGVLGSLLVGLKRFQSFRGLKLSPGRLSPVATVLVGVHYFLTALPLLLLGGAFWMALQWVLQTHFGVAELPPQAILDEFTGGLSPRLLAMIFLAVVMAPLAEELLFRGVLYRYLRTRIGLAMATTLSALGF